MKKMLKELLKILLVWITSTVIIYLALTISNFYRWCNEKQFLIEDDKILEQLDTREVFQLGTEISIYEQALENDLQKIKNGTYEEGQHSFAEYYDPLGFSVWSHMRLEIRNLIMICLPISILLGVAITIAYVVITSKKMNGILKFAIGYFGVMLIVPPIYMYTWTYRFWDIIHTYKSMPRYFYIGYTLIFVLMYVINYRIGMKMADGLNEAMKK